MVLELACVALLTGTFLLGLSLPGPVVAQSTAVPIRPPSTSVPDPTQAPPEPTEPPPATSPPIATSPPAATARPQPGQPGDEDDDDPPPAPGPGQPSQEATADPRPTRTRRPTRTPRTTPTASPTVAVLGGLQLSISVDPPQPVLRQRVRFDLDLFNQSGADLSELTLELLVPDVLLDYEVEQRLGETARAGRLLRWYLPGLPADSGTSMRITGVVGRSPGGQSRLCALLLSGGSPVEHCLAFEVLGRLPEAAADLSPSPPPVLLPTAEPQRGPVEEAAGLLRSGWSLLLLGLVILGTWLGLQLRGRSGIPESSDDTSDDP